VAVAQVAEFQHICDWFVAYYVWNLSHYDIMMEDEKIMNIID